MIKNVLITGDTHGRVEDRLSSIKLSMPEYLPEETAIIILGDVGLNYYKSKHDYKNKQRVAKFGYTIYCLRGNHEDRAENIEKARCEYDSFVGGNIIYEEEFPNIKYFLDYVAEYTIMGKKTLCIPGAYSVDKLYRLLNGWAWFPDEQLHSHEMMRAEQNFTGNHYDLVLSHTCPIDWEPSDLFLCGIDQSKVDKTMEVWMDRFKDMISWDLWLFAHYHTDRVEWPHVEIFYQETESLQDIIARWEKYDKTGELDWWIPVSPKFQKLVEKN